MWQTRALELNNQAYWNREKACELVEWAVKHEFNTIIVGQTDLFDKLVSPKGYTPHQYNDRLSSQQRARCVYLNRLGQLCQQKGLRFYLQAKEFNFPTDLLLAHPHLFEPGRGVRFDVDFWCGYLADKVSLICQRIPSLSGLLIAISNTDGLLPVSRPNWELQSEEEASQPQRDERSFAIYSRCFNTLSRVMQQENKHLVLRVFPAGNHDLGNVLEAIRPLPTSVSVSIKLTPERFWPSFPNNPALLAVQEREVWADIDLVGEEVGWGIFPFLRIDELQGRLLWCRGNPAIRGAVCKASWEGVDNHWIIGTLSECNLVACSRLLVSPDAGLTQAQLITYWLDEAYGWLPDEQTFAAFCSLLERAGQVLYNAIYVRDHVFHRHSQVPESYGQAVWSLYGQLNRSHWLPGSERDIFFSRSDVDTSAACLSRIASEKDEAGVASVALRDEALRFAQSAAFPWALERRWREEWEGFALYCHLFLHAQKAFFTLRFAHEAENSWSMREICQINIQELYRSASEMDDFCTKHADASPGLHVLFDASRVRALADSLSAELKSLKG
ncbi:hypothetical protein C3432_19290 [Citrobacter amalonaticus]|uniref:Uncharacterized protein n=1 Tax=Citrobacter amalonaticus TaxID=35703 RepID=A0A2S4RXN5_CITAM|nr:hypothetical protein [Citrobacter amalonaticus]POT56121.1 hypothetical protein C3432_19290 [Citrobacter amalonaticus]POT74430.1 hypothetical protein C3436_16930 [Citrobacter amalonaticus]POU65229.1 hypothetical protein C3430_13670 [Citrobacter amalonaticus]POV04064.1 hypothetical protein C3424_18610 [Citrobacter amalonaticus]